MKKIFYSTGIFFLFLLLTSVASAASVAITYGTVYDVDYSDMESTRNAWLSELGIAEPDTTIDFESGFKELDMILRKSLSGGLTISSPSSYANAQVTSNCNNIGGSNPLGRYASLLYEDYDYIFSFDSGINYFAFYLMDTFATDITVSYADGTSETIEITSAGSSGYEGRFVAFIFDKKVSSLTLQDLNGGDGLAGIDNIEFGSVASSPVPVPSTFILLGLGLLGTSLAARKSHELG